MSRPPLGERFGIAVLFATVAADRLGFGIGETHVRIEVVASVVVLCAALRVRLPSGLRVTQGRAGSEEWLIGAWLGTNLLASVVASPHPAQSAKLVLLLACLAAIYSSTVRLVRDEKSLAWAIEAWLVAGGGAALLSVLAALSFLLFDTRVGMQFEKTLAPGGAAATFRVRGPLWEPDILGSYAMTTALLSLGVLLGRGRAPAAPRSWLPSVALGLSLCALVSSLTRAALVATAVAGGLLLLVSARRGAPLPPRRALLRSAIVAGVGLVAGAALASRLPVLVVRDLPSREVTEDLFVERIEAARTTGGPGEVGSAPPGTDVRSALVHRLKGLGSPLRVPTVRRRIEQLGWVAGRWAERPWLGWGTGSSRYVEGAPNWILWLSNLELHLLHDTGLAGCFFFLAATGLVARRAWVAARAKHVPPGTDAWRPPLPGLLAGLLGLGITFQFTDGTWLGFFWAFLGLVASATRVAERARARRPLEHPGRIP